MSSTTTIPTWLSVVVAIGTPALTFLGVLVANRVTRLAASETESRSRREETMRNLRWAAELAVSDDPARADLGLRELRALGESAMNDPEQQTFIDAALESVVAPVAREVGTEASSDDVLVVVEGEADESGHGRRPTPDEAGDVSSDDREGA